MWVDCDLVEYQDNWRLWMGRGFRLGFAKDIAVRWVCVAFLHYDKYELATATGAKST